MKRIGVFFGGKSGEHEISLMSATAVIKAMDKSKYDIIKFGITKEGKWRLFKGETDRIADGSWEADSEAVDMGQLPEMIDFALPVLHGPYGEDGTIQGLFEMLDIPYAGCGVMSSAACMDKATTKKLFEEAGIPTSDFHLVYAEDVEDDIEKVADEIEADLSYVMYVKPSNMGSSVGISKVRTREELKSALVLAAKYDRRILIEEGVNCREVETGVIGNRYPEVAAVGEIVASADFYDYESKYTDDAGTTIVVPAELPKYTIEKIKEYAKRAYIALDCSGFARTDFFVDKETGEVYINEINTIPGFTKYSMFPLIWDEAGVPFGELIERIIDYGYERYNAKNNRQTACR